MMNLRSSRSLSEKNRGHSALVIALIGLSAWPYWTPAHAQQSEESSADAAPKLHPNGEALRAVRMAPAPLERAGTWLHGDRLTLARAEADTDGPELIDVTALAGERVLARMWTAPAGWRLQWLPGDALRGGQWHEMHCESARQCQEVRYRIVSAERDTSLNTMPGRGHNRDVWLYRVHFTVADDGFASGGFRSDTGRTWRPVCAGDRPGLFTSGRWRSDGSYDPNGYTFSCVAGAVAKCIRHFGYKPWMEQVADDGRVVDMHPLHLACVRAVRADYCGDGRAHTDTGTPIALSDRYQLNPSRAGTGLTREAGFDPGGAVSLRHPRRPLGEPLTCATELAEKRDRSAELIVYRQLSSSIE